MATHIVNGTKIQTEHVFPPIPVRTMDWSAVTDNYDLGHPIGRGATEQAAIDDLMEQLDEWNAYEEDGPMDLEDQLDAAFARADQQKCG